MAGPIRVDLDCADIVARLMEEMKEVDALIRRPPGSGGQARPVGVQQTLSPERVFAPQTI